MTFVKVPKFRFKRTLAEGKKKHLRRILQDFYALWLKLILFSNTLNVYDAYKICMKIFEQMIFNYIIQ